MGNFRKSALHDWLCSHFSVSQLQLAPLSGDAGFRNYYRFSIKNTPYIAVDAAPETSNNLGFVSIAKALKVQNVIVPEVFAFDAQAGFLCLSDLGEQLFADAVTENSMLDDYKNAIDELIKIITAKAPENYNLPIYDRAFITLELSIFKQWLLEKHLQINLTEQEAIKLEQCFNLLTDSALAQPQVFMHRDYHSRNIMQLSDEKLGIIDFQDAVFGPITYDIVSLLRDCYKCWPLANVEMLFDYFCTQATSTLELSIISKEQWRKWFDLMGLQRHLKASGIFARLYHRDGKSGYLQDIPLTLNYIVTVSKGYPELSFLQHLVSERVIPTLANLPDEKHEN